MRPDKKMIGCKKAEQSVYLALRRKRQNGNHKT